MKQMRRHRRTVLASLSAAAMTAGCGMPAPTGGGPAVSYRPHDEARYIARVADRVFRVNVRYVPMISESVIAVREGEGGADEAGWEQIEIRDTRLPGSGVPFADGDYRDVALGIAGEIERRGLVCGGKQRWRPSAGRDGEVRTLYRRERRAWVVFGGCPEKTKAAS